MLFSAKMTMENRSDDTIMSVALAAVSKTKLRPQFWRFYRGPNRVGSAELLVMSLMILPTSRCFGRLCNTFDFASRVLESRGDFGSLQLGHKTGTIDLQYSG